MAGRHHEQYPKSTGVHAVLGTPYLGRAAATPWHEVGSARPTLVRPPRRWLSAGAMLTTATMTSTAAVHAQEAICSISSRLSPDTETSGSRGTVIARCSNCCTYGGGTVTHPTSSPSAAGRAGRRNPRPALVDDFRPQRPMSAAGRQGCGRAIARSGPSASAGRARAVRRPRATSARG